MMPAPKRLGALVFCGFLSFFSGAFASSASEPGAPPPPRILLVTAHPDDDALFCGAVYKATHSLGGVVDLAVVTNGEGGYRFSTLAEPIYGLKLTDEAVGRAYLPGIRKQELMAGGAIVGIRNYFFLDQLDSAYSLDMAKVFAGEWDVDGVKKRLGEILAKGGYDFVFVMLPTPTTHAGHRASAILALQAVESRPAGERPIVLGGTGRVPNSQPAGNSQAAGNSQPTASSQAAGTGQPAAAAGERPAFTGLDEYPVTKIRPGAPVFEFDRTQKFGQDNRLDYTIISNWVIAEHKSQGTMQLGAGRAFVEQYLYFDLNPEAGLAKAKALFERLAAAPPHTFEPED